VPFTNEPGTQTTSTISPKCPLVPFKKFKFEKAGATISGQKLSVSSQSNVSGVQTPIRMRKN